MDQPALWPASGHVDADGKAWWIVRELPCQPGLRDQHPGVLVHDWPRTEQEEIRIAPVPFGACAACSTYLHLRSADGDSPRRTCDPGHNDSPKSNKNSKLGLYGDDLPCHQGSARKTERASGQ